jgi:hypothetical protein
MTSERREKTWNSLILLPVGLREPIASKLRAACWERRLILVPVGLAAILASFHNFSAVIMALVIASMAGILLLEISILNHFSSVVTWVNTIVGLLYTSLILIAATIVWQFTNRWIVFALTIVVMILVLIGLLSQIYLHLQNWSADE